LKEKKTTEIARRNCRLKGSLLDDPLRTRNEQNFLTRWKAFSSTDKKNEIR